MSLIKFLIPLFALALLASCTPATPTATPGTTNSYASSSTTAVMNNDGQTNSQSSIAPPAMPSSQQPPQPANPQTGFDGKLLTGIHTVVLKTSKGDITLQLNADKAPKAVTNFMTLSKMGFYNGLTFHRVIPGFMIQGGDPNGNGTGGSSIFGDTFEDEPNDLQMVKGVIAMANRGPNTNGSQFFITQADTPWLQGHHTVFGKVTSGMDIVDAITKADRDSKDMPTTPITFTVDVQN